MLLPPGIEKHKNLSTSFTEFEHLLQSLAENRFSGYIKLNFWGYEGVVVLDTGHIIEAYSAEDDVFLTGEQAVLAVIKKASCLDDGTIEVYDLPSEVALALAYALQAQKYEDQDAFINYTLGQIFDVLERESINGYIDIEFSGNKGRGTVYYLEGMPVEAVITSFSGRSYSGQRVFSKFLEIGERIQPYVIVYKTDNPHSIVEDEAFLIPWQHQKTVQFWKDFLMFMHSLMADQFRKNKFFSLFKKICDEVSDPYPFLKPGEGAIELCDQTFRVKRILYNPAFVQGMTIVLNKMLQQMSARRIRKLDLQKIVNQVQKIAHKYEIEKPNPQMLVQQVFRGILS